MPRRGFVKWQVFGGFLESFRPPFSKGGAGRGREALVARRNERNELTAVFGSFCGCSVKKNGENSLNVMKS